MIVSEPGQSNYDRMIAPAEIAEAVLYLASDAAAMVTGTVIAIDGGKSLGVPAPRRAE
jgi:NAD(P)-dependent dehydrogenase (short-subunit alcohol dehydrogenase family)